MATSMQVDSKQEALGSGPRKYIEAMYCITPRILRMVETFINQEMNCGNRGLGRVCGWGGGERESVF